MITDVHTHFWNPDHQQSPWTDGLGRVATRLAAGPIDRVTVESYRKQVFPAARSIVFGLQAQASGIMVPNDAVAAFVRGVAQLGGFLGRKCDGQPGWKVLWRGYKKLQNLVAGARLHEQILRQQRATQATVRTADDVPEEPP